MFKRYYFYHVELQSKEQPQFSTGIVIATSWLEDPDAAFGKVLDYNAAIWKCDRSTIRCLAFNRV